MQIFCVECLGGGGGGFILRDLPLSQQFNKTKEKL